MVIIMCEYDALPEIGHACGHNLVSECAIAAALGVKKALEEDDSLSGKVRESKEYKQMFDTSQGGTPKAT